MAHASRSCCARATSGSCAGRRSTPAGAGRAGAPRGGGGRGGGKLGSMALTAERKYRLLLELSQRISRTLDLEAVLADLLQALRSAVAYDAAGGFVLTHAGPL